MQNKEPVSEVEINEMLETLFDDPFQDLDSHLLNSSYFGWPLI